MSPAQVADASKVLHNRYGTEVHGCRELVWVPRSGRGAKVFVKLYPSRSLVSNGGITRTAVLAQSAMYISSGTSVGDQRWHFSLGLGRV